VRVYVDPIPTNGNDRASVVIDVTSLFNNAAPDFVWGTEVSNNGTAWVPVATAGSGGATAVAGLMASQPFVGLAYEFVRFWFELTAGAGVIAGVTFDAHADISKV
jgi:hypothetical protein